MRGRMSEDGIPQSPPSGGASPLSQGGRADTQVRPYGMPAVIRHCEEDRRPDAAIHIPPQRGTDSHGPSGASG